MTARPNLASAASRLTLKGLYVFPLTPGTKIPRKGTRGYRDATREVDVVRAWWQRWPDANIGIATGKASGLWVLDVDPRHGGDETLASLERDHGPLPATIMSATPRGGRHYYFRWDDSIPEIRNSTGRVAEGVDVLAEGGSAVAPPSVIAGVGRYAWSRTGAPLATAPQWLVDLTRAPVPTPRSPTASAGTSPLQSDVDRYCAAAITDELRRLAEAGQGQRNDQLNQSAFALAQFVAADVVPEIWARSILEDTAREIGLSVIEARRTINSAFKVGMLIPRILPQ